MELSFDQQERVSLFAPGGAYLPFDETPYQKVRQDLAIFEGG